MSQSSLSSGIPNLDLRAKQAKILIVEANGVSFELFKRER
jgi:hypothetical protein